jgi:hypothetical protein
MRTQSNLFADYEDKQASGAVFSPCQIYRYRLERRWSTDGDRTVLWVMLNPSTADAKQDDPTVRRCVGFSQAWGYDRLIVCNLFALRATNPKELIECNEPIGEMNDHYISTAARKADLIVAAWGAHHMAVGRGESVLSFLPRPVLCLGVTRVLGAPRHPLYVHRSQELVYLNP